MGLTISPDGYSTPYCVRSSRNSMLNHPLNFPISLVSLFFHLYWMMYFSSHPPSSAITISHGALDTLSISVSTFFIEKVTTAFCIDSWNFQNEYRPSFIVFKFVQNRRYSRRHGFFYGFYIFTHLVVEIL